MNKRTTIVAATLVAVSMAMPLFAAQRTWIGPNNGKWSVAANWTDGAVPSGTGDSAEFTNATPMNVEIDVEDTVLAVYFGDRDATPPEKGSGYIRFFGNGSITQTSSYMRVYTNTCFILDGPTVNAKGFCCYDGAKVEVRSGNLNLSSSPELTKDEGGRSEFLVCGGSLKTVTVVPYDRSVFAMTSGTLRLTGTSGRVPDLNYSALLPSQAFRVTGGELYATRFMLPALKRLDIKADKLCIGQNIHALTASPNTRLDVFSDMTFGAFGDWNFNNRGATVNLYGDTTVDTTDCDDGETARSIFLANLSPMPDSSLSITGVGTTTLGFTSAAQHKFSSVSVGANATLNLGSTGLLRTEGLSLASGAKIALSAEGGDMIETYSAPVAAAGSTLEVTLPATPTAAAKYPVLVSDAGGIDDVPVTIANPSGTWGVERAEGCLYLSDGNDVAASQITNEWRGGTSGYWGDAANWTGNAAPTAKNSIAYFSGTKNTVITNDVTSIDLLRQLYFYEGGPFIIRGRAFRISATEVPSAAAAIVSESSLPVRIEVNFTGTGSPYTGVYATKNSFIELAGTTTISHWFSPGGDVRVSGALTAQALYLASSSGLRSSRLTVLSGGRVTIENQSGKGNARAMTRVLPICVEDGGTFAIVGGEAYWMTNDQTFHVNGTIDFTAPFSLENMTLTILGSGRMNVSSVKSLAGKTSKLVLGAGIRLCPAAWTTVTSDGTDACFPIEIDSTATFLATNDWTYGVAEGVSATTEPGRRAIKIASPFGSLTVDTDDPDNVGVSHTVTFADPVCGSGSLVKKGAGTLVLASDENAVTGKVTVAEGTLRMTANQSFTSLSAAGATLSFAAGVSASVSEDLNLDGVTLVVDGITRESSWTPVIVATGDAEIAGTPSIGSEYAVRLRDNTVFVKKKLGFVISIK